MAKTSCLPSSFVSHAPPTLPQLPNPAFFLFLCHLHFLISWNPPLFSPNFPFSWNSPPRYTHTHFLSEPIITCPFKLKPPEDTKAKSLISYIPWAKTELQRCSQVTKDPYRFAEKFSHKSLKFSAWFLWACLLVHMLVWEGRPNYRMKTRNCENPERSLELQLETRSWAMLSNFVGPN